jgi:hypothetical protein
MQPAWALFQLQVAEGVDRGGFYDINKKNFSKFETPSSAAFLKKKSTFYFFWINQIKLILARKANKMT